MPFLINCKVKMGSIEGDVEFETENETIKAVLTGASRLHFGSSAASLLFRHMACFINHQSYHES